MICLANWMSIKLFLSIRIHVLDLGVLGNILTRWVWVEFKLGDEIFRHWELTLRDLQSNTNWLLQKVLLIDFPTESTKMIQIVMESCGKKLRASLISTFFDSQSFLNEFKLALLKEIADGNSSNVSLNLWIIDAVFKLNLIILIKSLGDILLFKYGVNEMTTNRIQNVWRWIFDDRIF